MKTKHLQIGKARCWMLLLLMLPLMAGEAWAENNRSVPTGAVNGLFSVSANKKVYFSKGNLQYQASTNTWRFAANQWDRIGSGNSGISSSYSGWIDLFGWGTSGYNHGATSYQPWSTSTTDSYYYAYGSNTSHLYNNTGKADWGYNAISNGGNQENLWRTLTGGNNGEWDYLLNVRNTSSGIRYAKARVNNINGIIIVPDDWRQSTYTLNQANSGSASYSSNTITVSTWNDIIEPAGCVFLPTTGLRGGTIIGLDLVETDGDYWSSSYSDNNYASFFFFASFGIYPKYTDERCHGMSVCLVQNYTPTQYTINATANPTNGGTITGAGTFGQGETVTLTAQPNMRYEFVNWTENNTVVSTNPTYSFTVTTNRDLVANFQICNYDFSAVCSSGQTLYYNITDNNTHTVTLTFPSIDNTPWNGYQKPTGDITLPNTVMHNGIQYSVTAIGDSAFRNCGDLTGSLNIPNSVTSIGNGAFSYCLNLSILTIGNSVTTIGSGAFNQCNYLSRVNYSGTIAQWCQMSFGSRDANPLYYAHNLYIGNNLVQNLVIPGTITETKPYIFCGASCLTSLTINNSVTSIGDYTFYGCNNLTGILTIPNSVTTIGYAAFQDCRGFTGDLIIPNSVTTIGGSAFSYCYGFTGNLVISNSVTSINGSTFKSCSRLTGDLVIPNSVISVGEKAFDGCSGFSGCLTIPNSVTSISSDAFRDCSNLNAIEVNKSTPPSAKSSSFTRIPVTIPVRIPCDATSVYQSAGGWNNFTNYQEDFNYTLTVSSSNTDMGTVTVTQQPSCGVNAIVKATPKANYQFVNWTKGNNVVSTDAVYTFAVTEDIELVANFAISNYTISASANPAIGGTVTGADTYNHGANVTLTATANEGYTFVNWTENDVEVSTSPNYSFTATADRNLVANFSLNSYTISASANPAVGGTVSGAGSYNHGASVTLTATANEGYTFINWTENDVEVSTDAEYSFTVEANRNLVANFAIQTFEITASANNSDYGTVTGGGTFDYGTMATLTATPNTGYTFVNWTENDVEVSTDAEYGFTVNADRNLVANFAIQTFEITASTNNSDYGTVTGGGTFDYGTMATLTATPNTGYTFINWTENNVEVSTDAEYSFTVEANRNLVANFAAASTGNHWNPDISLYSDNMSVVAEIHIDGAVQTSADIEIGAFCGEEVRGSRRVEYKGVPFDRYVAFLTVYGESNDNITFKVYDHQNNEELNCRVAQSLTFTPNGTVGDLISPYVIEFFTTANITATANPTAGGTVSGDGVYSVGEIVTLTAIADEYYRFVNWTENDVEVSTSETYSFTAFDDRNLVANFEIKNHWTPDESLYADNMSVVGEIRIDGMTQTSGDIEIGAFCGEEVRGSQRISYTPAPVDKYLVFLTVYGEPNDNITFRLYNHQTGSEYDLTAPEPVTFAPNATVGGLNTPHILNFCHTQSRELTAGWNWYSTCIDIEGEDGFNMLTAGLGEDGLQVKSQSQFALYYPEYDIWTGSLNEADNHKLYMIQMSSPHTLVMTGAFTDVESTPITINKGWTWIGYPVTQNMSLDEATSNINPSNGDYFKSQSGFSIYYEGYGWAGSLNTLEPGHGYMYQNNGESSMTLVYPTPGAKGTLEENVTADGNHWIPNAYQFADNMSVVAVINIDGVEQLSENLEVGAFSDGECRGSARPIYVEAVGRYMLFMTVYGKGGENLDFRLFDADDNEEYQLQTSMVFEPNGTVGNLVNPYVFDLSVMGIGEEQPFAFSFCPNPISSGRQLAIEGEYDKIEIINSIGVVIGEYTNTNEIEITMIPSVYYIRAINDKSIIINKLVVKQ